MRDEIRVDVASPPDREKLVVQIMIGSEQWAEINQQESELQLEIYPRQDSQPWVIELDAAVRVLTEARQKLLAGNTTSD
jgi:hypothetical protein